MGEKGGGWASAEGWLGNTDDVHGDSTGQLLIDLYGQALPSCKGVGHRMGGEGESQAAKGVFSGLQGSTGRVGHAGGEAAALLEGCSGAGGGLSSDVAVSWQRFERKSTPELLGQHSSWFLVTKW